LDELGAIESLPTGLGLMVLTTLEGDKAKSEAKKLIDRSSTSRDIISLVSTIVLYKFESLSREEVDVMLGIELQQTRVYREAVAEGRQAGEASVIMRQLNRRLGSVPADRAAQIQQLTVPQLEDLGEALLDFTNLTDLETWMNQNLR
jgi:predicted transposase YdaD